MIEFEASDSPFYVANKRFLDEYTVKLPVYQFTGWCNAYGYDVTGTAHTNEYTISLNIIKHQTTRNGVYVPLDALDNTEVVLEITGLKIKSAFVFGNSLLEKLISLNQTKVDSETERILVDFAVQFKPRKLILKKGKLLLKFINPTQSLDEIVKNLEVTLKKCSLTK